MHKLLPTILFAVLFFPASAQKILRPEADSLLKSLRMEGNGRNRLFALLKLADFNIGKPGERKDDLDSAADFIQQARQLNAHLSVREGNGYIALAECYLYKERGQKPLARQRAEMAVQLLSSAGGPWLLGKAYFALSEFFNYRIPAELQARIDLVEKARTCYEQAGKQQLEAYSLERLAELYMHFGKWSKALEDGRLAIKKYQQANYPNLQGVYILMSQVYGIRENLQQSVYYSLLALQSAAEAKDSSMQLCQINYATADTYFSLHEYGKALHYFQDALKVADKYHDTLQVYVVGIGVATLFNNWNAPSKSLHFLDSLSEYYPVPENIPIRYQLSTVYLASYEQLKNISKARIWCDSLLGYLNSPHLYNGDRYYIYEEIMQFYLISGQYRKARDSLSVYRHFAAQSNVASSLGAGYLIAFRLDTAQHDYKSAVYNLLRYNARKDSILDKEKSRQIQELQVAYETSEKEKNIVVLEKEGELQKRALSQSNETTNFSIFGAGLLALLLGVGFSRYRLKQQKNRQLEFKQKEITAKNQQLERLLHENKWLLREVHHRVKNNLQVVMSLLNSQSAYLQDEKALNAVLESQHRVQAMSLIHQKLYQSSNVSSINMPEYVNDLVEYLRDSFNGGSKVRFDLQIAAISLDVVQAVPVGLILNEVITNAFKHAFPHGADDAILVRLLTPQDGEISLVIADNGRGFPADLDTIVNNSFGRLLIHGLVEDLDGSMTVDRSDGTAYCIDFRRTIPGEKSRAAAAAAAGSL